MNKKNCIFETERITCKPNPAESFVGIICREHLNTVYGVDICYQEFNDQNKQLIVGPYLRASNNWKFEVNTVIFPDKPFFDKVFNTFGTGTEVQLDDFNYTMNPKISQFIRSLQLYDKNTAKTEINDRRYHYEIVRHLGVENPENITDFETFLLHTQNNIQDRLSTLKNKISHSNNEKLFNIMSVDMIEPLIDDEIDIRKRTTIKNNVSLSAFHKFLISNMLLVYHNTLANISVVHHPSLQPNIRYKKDIGFVVVQEFLDPMYLTILGQEQGNMHYYAMKATVRYRQPKDLPIPMAKDYPDSVHLYNSLTNKMSGGKIYNC